MCSARGSYKQVAPHGASRMVPTPSGQMPNSWKAWAMLIGPLTLALILASIVSDAQEAQSPSHTALPPKAGLRVPACTAYLEPLSEEVRVAPEGVENWVDPSVKVLWFGDSQENRGARMLRGPAPPRGSRVQAPPHRGGPGPRTAVKEPPKGWSSPGSRPSASPNPVTSVHPGIAQRRGQIRGRPPGAPARRPGRSRRALQPQASQKRGLRPSLLPGSRRA